MAERERFVLIERDHLVDSIGWRRVTASLITLAVLIVGPLVQGAEPTTTRPASSTGDQASTQPAAATRPDSARVDSLIEIIIGKNPPETRFRVARELLLQAHPAVPDRLAAILTDGDAAARIAVARALADTPEQLAEAYIDPLFGLLAAQDDDLQDVAGLALAAYRDNGVAPRLIELARDAENPKGVRLAAIRALGHIRHRTAVEGLVQLLDDVDSEIVSVALAALERATAMDFGGDVARAQTVWQAHRDLPLEQWQQLQIDRLVREKRELAGRLAAMEVRLVRVLQMGFEQATESTRAALLGEYLADESTLVQRLGLELLQVQLAEGKLAPQDMSPALRDRARALLQSDEPQIRATAVRAVASFRDPADAPRFLELLTDVRDEVVARALINGLGYVGGANSVDTLIKMVQLENTACATEAAAALGRLVERGVLPDDAHDRVAQALIEAFGATASRDVALRERLLWAMEVLADDRFAAVFAASLDEGEAVVVRLAALRGLAALGEPGSAEALLAAMNDEDPSVRKLAVTTLAQVGTTDAHLSALWQHLNPEFEPDENVRQEVTRVTLDLLARKSAEEIQHWVARLPTGGTDHGERRLALLELLARKVAESGDEARDRLGVVRARIAALHAEQGDHDDAVQAYIAALADLHAGKSAATQTVSNELLSYALRHNLYNEAIARTLRNGNPKLPGEAGWKTIRAEVERRIERREYDAALGLLILLENLPPCELPADAVAQLKARIESLRAPATTQPTTSPTTQPG